MTHHHHGLILSNLRKLSGGHPLGPFRPLGGKSRGGQKLSHCGLGFLGIEEFTFLPYSFKHFSIGFGIGALPVWKSILPFTDVLGPIGFGMGAFAVIPRPDS